MNCDEFEKLLLEDPQRTDALFHQHRHQCAHCQRYFEEIAAFDRKLADSFEHEVDADFLQGLEQQLVVKAGRQRRMKKLRFAAAASLVLVFTAAFFTYHLHLQRSLPEFVLAHIDHEIEYLDSTITVNPAYLDHLLDRFNARYLTVLNEITYAERCWMKTGYGLHLIFRGSDGPVTLLLMPSESSETPQLVQSDRFQGKIYRLQQGSFAVVGEPGEPIEMLAEDIRMAMTL